MGGLRKAFLRMSLNTQKASLVKVQESFLAEVPSKLSLKQQQVGYTLVSGIGFRQVEEMVRMRSER